MSMHPGHGSADSQLLCRARARCCGPVSGYPGTARGSPQLVDLCCPPQPRPAGWHGSDRCNRRRCRLRHSYSQTDLDQLRRRAAALVPALGDSTAAPQMESWAGLRPAAADRLPLTRTTSQFQASMVGRRTLPQRHLARAGHCSRACGPLRTQDFRQSISPPFDPVDSS